MSNVVILSARLSSFRLAQKCMLPLGIHKSVIEFLVHRLLHFNFSPIVFTSDHQEDEVISRECARLGVNVFRGELENKLKRWQDGLIKFGIPWAHFADMDDPFLDPVQIRNSINSFVEKKLDYLRTSNLSDSGYASVGSTLSLDFLNRVTTRAKSLSHNNFDVIPWNLLIAEEDRVEQLKDFCYFYTPQLRLTLDYKEDYILLNHLANQLGALVERSDVEYYLMHNPQLMETNSGKIFDFRQRQLDAISSFEKGSGNNAL